MFARRIKKRLAPDFDKPAFIDRYYVDGEGRAVVRVKLTDGAGVFSPYSPCGREELDESLASYLDGVIYYIPLKYPLVILFDGAKTDAATEDKIKSVITNHYCLVLDDKKQDLRLNLMMICAMLVVGALLLGFSYYLSSVDADALFCELINIAGTFSFWEVVELYMLDRKQKKLEKLNALQTASAEIVFADPGEVKQD